MARAVALQQQQLIAKGERGHSGYMETRSNHILVGGVVLALLAGLVAFIIWLAGMNQGQTKDYDIFFRNSVEGLSKGSSVTFAGVPSGQVKMIELWMPNPEFVRVRISVDEKLPVLVGTTASIGSTSFTGPSQIQLVGAAKGAPPISDIGPAGAPTIPTRTAGLGALLNNAPQLIERLSGLTERLTEILSDENQTYFSGILKNVDKASGALASSTPDLKAAINDTRVTIRQAGTAVDAFGKLANNGNATLSSDVKPMLADLRRTVAAAEGSMKNLDAALAAVKPGLNTLSTQTLPEVNLLVRDLRTMSDTLGSVATKVDQQGVGALVGGPKLPDYEPGKIKP
jgi:phospholipid/cholesterol/gamma-HCH transport system substrate-binding protein